jgi:hypothetical protein
MLISPYAFYTTNADHQLILHLVRSNEKPARGKVSNTLDNLWRAPQFFWLLQVQLKVQELFQNQDCSKNAT